MSLEQHKRTVAAFHDLMFNQCRPAEAVGSTSMSVPASEPCVTDKSNGYEPLAEVFASSRNQGIGAAAVREWAGTLPRGAAVLDLGCGTGVPISEALMHAGCAVFGVDASEKMVRLFSARFPDVAVACEAVEDSTFFDRTFDGVTAWGLMFLLPVTTQALLIEKASRVLEPGGSFLFTAPLQVGSWADALTGRESVSPGADWYRAILAANDLRLIRELDDEGDNHYYVAKRSVTSDE